RPSQRAARSRHTRSAASPAERVHAAVGARGQGRLVSRWGRGRGGGIAVALAQALLPADLAAQLGEAQFGAIASYGTSSAWHGGAGLIAGVGAGRLIYVGARWVYYFGSSAAQTDTGGTFQVRDRAQIFAADVGLPYP